MGAEARTRRGSRPPAVIGRKALTAQPGSRGPRLAGWAVGFVLLFVAAYALLWFHPDWMGHPRRRWMPTGAGKLPSKQREAASPPPRPASKDSASKGKTPAGSSSSSGPRDGSAHALDEEEATSPPSGPASKDVVSAGKPSAGSSSASEPLDGSAASEVHKATSKLLRNASKDTGSTDKPSTTASKAGSTHAVEAQKPTGASPPPAGKASKDNAPKAEASTASTNAGRPLDGWAHATKAQKDAAPFLEKVPVVRREKPSYAGFREMAMQLSGMLANATIKALEEQDPYGVRGFERRLVERELLLNRTLEHGELAELFPCPAPEDRITYADQMSLSNAVAFRNRSNGTFLFFQHMSKSAGTLFCKLAQANLPKEAVPAYLCMPDVTWSKDSIAYVPSTSKNVNTTFKNKGCAGCLGRWTNNEITARMREAGHLVACNEWDAFDERFLQLQAVFAVVLRRPTDRALSHYKFFCVNFRCGKSTTPREWWETFRGLDDIYVRKLGRNGTAHGERRMRKLPANERAARLASALDVVVRFQAVLVTEWLAYAGPLVQRVLGFSNVSLLVSNVRPHTRGKVQPRVKNGAVRFYDPENVKAREYFGEELFQTMQEDLAADEILTDAARRVFLERTVCDDG